jgi:carbon-monoxide dehydrogenase medium subunit
MPGYAGAGAGRIAGGRRAQGDHMKAGSYALEPAVSVTHASQRLHDEGWGAKPVAGGQSLGAMLNLRLAQPHLLIDLDALPQLGEVVQEPDAVTFGPMVTHAHIEDRRCPDPSHGLMPFVARGIAYRAVRNRGTLGGSLCHADPAADWVNTMPLLGATLVLTGPQGAREVPARNFVVSAFETCLAEDELLTQIRVPRRSAATRWAYRKFCRKAGEFAHALAACLHDAGDATERVVLGALDGRPCVIDGPGLLAYLRQDAARKAWLLERELGLDVTRLALLDEMLRLALKDMEIAR